METNYGLALLINPPTKQDSLHPLLVSGMPAEIIIDLVLMLYSGFLQRKVILLAGKIDFVTITQKITNGVAIKT